ncbi:MAG: Heme ABC exporter, ATP-binding protein CcmA [Burkholderia sp.]|jgi:heme exporter protein A
MPEPLLELKDIACERGERILYRGLSFAVRPGELVRIAGSNGAGKTTLLRIAAGLMRPTEGDVLWRGVPVRKAAQDYWKELCYIGHRNGVKDDLSALENVMISAEVASRGTTREAAEKALEAVGLAGFFDAPAGHLSQGQRRRVALARLWLSQDVTLWALDEPFTALDVKGVARLAALVAEHVRAGGAVMLVTHQEVDVPGVAPVLLEPEKWAPRRRSAVETALADEAAAEEGKAP